MPGPGQSEPHVYLDRSGDLREGYFYQITFEDDIDRPASGEVLLKREPSEESLLNQGRMYFDCMFETGFDLQYEERHDCPEDRTHVTQSWWRDLKVMIDPDDAGPASPFVSMLSDMFAVLIRDDLLTSLKSSGLTGWQTSEVIYALQSGTELGRTTRPGRYPKLWYFQFRGRGRLRSRSVRNAPNACPFCGFGRVICRGCRWSIPECPQCHRVPTMTQARAARLGKEVPDGTLIWEDKPEYRRGILEGEHWDGTDFLQISCGWGEGPFTDDRHIVTSRALNWLEARRAAPLYAQPLPVCVDGMTPEQLRRLDRAWTA